MVSYIKCIFLRVYNLENDKCSLYLNFIELGWWILKFHKFMNLKKLLFWSRLSFPSEKLINRIKLLRKKIRVQLKSFGSRQTRSLKSKGGSLTIWDRTNRRLLASSRRDAGDYAHQLLSPVKLVWLCSTSITERRVTANIDRAISFAMRFSSLTR